MIKKGVCDVIASLFRKREKKPKVEHFCITCKHYVPHPQNLIIDGKGHGGCRAPKNLKLYPENGNTVPRYKYASTLRMYWDDCGPQGRWWTPKEEQ